MKQLLILLFLFSRIMGQAQVERTISVPFTSGASLTHPALLYLPDNYAATGSRYPLLVFLHGAGQSCPPLSAIYNHPSAGGPSFLIEHSRWPSSFTDPVTGQTFKFIVLSPQSGCNSWSSDGNQTDYAIRYMVEHYRVDTNRIYLTGISAGGDGIVRYLAHLPSDAKLACNPKYKIAAFVPMSEAGGDIGPANAAKITMDRVRCWGFGDPAGDPHGYNTQVLTEQINKSVPGLARFTSYKGGHNGWNNYYSPVYRETIRGKPMNIYEWMLQFTRSNAAAPVPASDVQAAARNPASPQASTNNLSAGDPSSSGSYAEKAIKDKPPTALAPTRQPVTPPGGCPSHKKYYLTPGYQGGVVIAPYGGGEDPYVYTGGDTLVFRADQTWGDIVIDGINGTSQSCPITIINEGGQVQFRTSHLLNAKWIHWTGMGSSKDFYGFRAQVHPHNNNLGGVGVSFEGRSKCVTYDHIFMHNVNQGVFAHTENTCIDSLIYPNWVMDSLIVHDCRIVGTAHEGMYIGSTSPDNAANSYDPRPVNCNGRIIYPRPMRTGYVHVYNCILDSTGRGGIQVSAASRGTTEIDHNTVRHSGMSGVSNQGTGISIGAYTHAYIHDNTVINTLTWSIASLGGSGTNVPVRIENNYIDSTGYLYTYNNISDNVVTTPSGPFYPPGKIPGNEENMSFVSPIFLKTVPTQQKDSTMFWIRNNRLGLSKGGPEKIKLQNGYNTIRKKGNFICNNINLSDHSPVQIRSEIGSFATWSTDCGSLRQ